MKNNAKVTADQEAICQALEQLQDSMDMIQHIVSRLRRSVSQAQANQHAELPLKTELSLKTKSQQNYNNQDTHLQHVGNRRHNDRLAIWEEQRFTDDLPKVLH